MNDPDIDEKIAKIKDRIAECRDYISSDFCARCAEVYKEVHTLENELKILEYERNRQS